MGDLLERRCGEIINICHSSRRCFPLLSLASFRACGRVFSPRRGGRSRTRRHSRVSWPLGGEYVSSDGWARNIALAATRIPLREREEDGWMTGCMQGSRGQPRRLLERQAGDRIFQVWVVHGAWSRCNARSGAWCLLVLVGACWCCCWPPGAGAGTLSCYLRQSRFLNPVLVDFLDQHATTAGLRPERGRCSVTHMVRRLTIAPLD